MKKNYLGFRNLGYPHYASIKFTPEQYKEYVKNNNKIFMGDTDEKE